MITVLFYYLARNNNKKVIKNNPPAYSLSLNVPIMLAAHSLACLFCRPLAEAGGCLSNTKLGDQKNISLAINQKDFGVFQSWLTQWAPPKAARGVYSKTLACSSEACSDGNKICTINHISAQTAERIWCTEHRENGLCWDQWRPQQSRIRYITVLQLCTVQDKTLQDISNSEQYSDAPNN